MTKQVYCRVHDETFWGTRVCRYCENGWTFMGADEMDMSLDSLLSLLEYVEETTELNYVAVIIHNDGSGSVVSGANEKNHGTFNSREEMFEGLMRMAEEGMPK